MSLLDGNGDGSRREEELVRKIESHLQTSGETERLEAHLKNRLYESPWKLEVEQKCDRNAAICLQWSCSAATS